MLVYKKALALLKVLALAHIIITLVFTRLVTAAPVVTGLLLLSSFNLGAKAFAPGFVSGRLNLYWIGGLGHFVWVGFVKGLSGIRFAFGESAEKGVVATFAFPAHLCGALTALYIYIWMS